MKKVTLGSSELQVSEVCLGTMTWGQQNTQQDASDQIEYALDKDINFIDTAEMYSVPPSKETYGSTETYIGNWFSANPGKREQLVLASKMAGSGVPWVRGGSNISADTVGEAIEGSLKRLQTDYIDLYQLHWPNRFTPHFAKHWPAMADDSAFNVERQREGILGILRALDDAIKAGKIRHIGLSNDTPWGIAEYLKMSAENDLPKIVSLQNEFSLLHLKDSPYITEMCAYNDIAYLPWSPLAGGALSGKYADGKRPQGCRWTMVQRNGIFRDTSQTHSAIDAYREVAERHNLSLTQLSLAWAYQFKGVTSAIIGATSMEQLKEDIGAYEISLSEQILEEIDSVIKRFPSPF